MKCHKCPNFRHLFDKLWGETLHFPVNNYEGAPARPQLREMCSNLQTKWKVDASRKVQQMGEDIRSFDLMKMIKMSSHLQAKLMVGSCGWSINRMRTVESFESMKTTAPECFSSSTPPRPHLPLGRSLSLLLLVRLLASSWNLDVFNVCLFVWNIFFR